jgi:tetratricopeptide (TPR) repeat protein
MTEHESDITGMLNRAMQFHRAGELKPAEEIYCRVLAIHQEHAEALHLMGLVHFARRQWSEAKALIQRAIRNNGTVPAFYVSYGDVLRCEERPAQALKWYHRALKLNPLMIEALCNMGIALCEQGQVQEAINCYRTAVGINPHQPQLFNNLGLAYQQQRQYRAAENCFRKALSLDFEYMDAYNNLGTLFRETGDLESALKTYHRALTLTPHNTSVNYNLGLLYQGQKKIDKAALHYEQAVAHDPPVADAYHNLGTFSQGHNRHDTAIDYFDRAIAMDPHHSDAQFSRSLSLLAMGRFEEGWKSYEWRFKRDAWTRVYPHRLKGRRWDGRTFAGETLFVHSEQGFGDTIWFARYLPIVKSLGGKVIFECRPELFELMKSVKGVDRLVTMSFQVPPAIEYDCFIPLMSLPGVMATTLDNIPCDTPYLSSSQVLRDLWSQRIDGPVLKIGLVWAAKSTNEHNRSCPAEEFLPLCELKGIQRFGLQKGAAENRFASMGGDIMINLGADFNSFSDTAGAVECLDLIISVDTSVAHLAGAMAKPVWLLLPYAADWKWLMNRSDSPWYPTMRLFRQTEPGDWKSVMSRIVIALQKWMITKHGEPD